MTKWIITGAIVIILAVGGWFYQDTIVGLFGRATPPAEEEVQVDPMAGWGSYASSTMGISVRYAPGYALDDSYEYTQVSPTKPIGGVKFTIPVNMATGTNLSSDTYVSVEQLPRANRCTGDIFVADTVVAREVVDGGIVYSVATTSGAGAGNRYEETVYAIKDSKPCTAVRYFVHYGAIGNYPEGTVHEFDRQALMGSFDSIRRTLQLTGSAAAETTTP